MPAVKKNPLLFKDMKNTTSLLVWPNNLDALELSQIALQDMSPRIVNLLLNCSALRNQPTWSGAMSDTSTNPGIITRTLFKHMAPFDRCTPLNLREFFLTDTEVYHASTTILKVINFQNLESLILDGCPGASNVFSEMCKTYARPTGLKRICWVSNVSSRVASIILFDNSSERLCVLLQRLNERDS